MLEALEASGAYRATSLESPRGSDDEAGDTLGDTVGTEEHGFARAEERATLAQLLRAVTPREREVLRLRFEEDLTQAEIGDRIGVSQMQVSRIIRQSLARLRTVARAGAAGGLARAARAARRPGGRGAARSPWRPRSRRGACGCRRSWGSTSLKRKSTTPSGSPATTTGMAEACRSPGTPSARVAAASSHTGSASRIARARSGWAATVSAASATSPRREAGSSSRPLA